MTGRLVLHHPTGRMEFRVRRCAVTLGGSSALDIEITCLPGGEHSLQPIMRLNGVAYVQELRTIRVDLPSVEEGDDAATLYCWTHHTLQGNRIRIDLDKLELTWNAITDDVERYGEHAVDHPVSVECAITSLVDET